MTFEAHGREYEIDSFGAIHQTDARPFVYDDKYCATYDTEAYKKQSDVLQALRLGFVIASYGTVPTDIIDYGYGNGAFMLFAKQVIPIVQGYDLTGIEVDGCSILKKLKPTKVVTFWDCLEHIPYLSFLTSIDCELICLSLPNCPHEELGLDWFANEYRHRKPDEHLHHFNLNSLILTMDSLGWYSVARSYHEDIVRKGNGTYPNILTMAFKRK